MNVQPDRRSGHDRRVTQEQTAVSAWFSEEVRMTRGFLLAVVVVVFAFAGFGAWAAIHTVQSLRDEDCLAANAQRQIVREVAHDLVDNDRFLVGLADSLGDGLPPEFVDPLDQRYDGQDEKIDAIGNVPC